MARALDHRRPNGLLICSDMRLRRSKQACADALDAAAERLWDDILNEMHEQNFRTAIEKGRELDSWLRENSAQLSPEAGGRSYLLLARLELIRVAESAGDPHNVATVEELVRKAREVFGSGPSPENQARLLSFEATLRAYAGDTARALQILGVGIDAALVTTRLSIWFDSGSFQEAADHVRTLALDDKWCEHAVLAFASTGDFDEAQRRCNGPLGAVLAS